MSTQATASGNSGPLGQRRGILFVLLIGLITFGIYFIYWAYKTHEEMKQHTGDGLGGILGLVVWIIVSAVSVFVIPSEVGNMYAKSGRPKPLTGWTGLWAFPFGIFIIPLIVWFVKVQGSLNRYWESAAITAPDAPRNEPGIPAPQP
jgi:Domain of unknown function (DUF4234)